MKYTSTRSFLESSSAPAIIKGLAADGGLYVPDSLPHLDIKQTLGKSYPELAHLILETYFSELSSDAIKSAVEEAYSLNNFNTQEITSIRPINDHVAVLELFHGQTSAFKDLALVVFSKLLSLAQKASQNDQLMIVTATSGDTGKAAMEAFKNLPGVTIAVLYPHNGVSAIQKLQMQTQTGDNVFPIAIDGDFDDAQRTVKAFFEEKTAIPISSANSINIARLLPQIVYYWDAYLRLVRDHTIIAGQKINVYVPTGNFGNICAGFIAKKMGLPIDRLIACTNENDVVHQFIQTGVYDISMRTLVKTPSPSMDILIASNLERLLWFVFQNESWIKEWMDSLNRTGRFELTPGQLAQLKKEMDSQSTSNSQTQQAIAAVFAQHDYLMDPHTACAFSHPFDSSTYNLVLATASPYKFIDIYKEIFELGDIDDFTAMEHISELTHTSIPHNLSQLQNSPIRFDTVIRKEDAIATLHQLIERITQ